MAILKLVSIVGIIVILFTAFMNITGLGSTSAATTTTYIISLIMVTVGSIGYGIAWDSEKDRKHKETMKAME